MRLGGPDLPVTLHPMPVEMVRGTDVIVSSKNVHLETSKLFRNSLSAALRRAAIGSRTGRLLVAFRSVFPHIGSHGERCCTLHSAK